jgi:general secretion pathway protein B
MSFILDALKKSESERQRQAGPALFEVKVAPPRHRIAPWAAALAALLAVNLGVVGWMLIRDRSAHDSAAVHEQTSLAAPTAAASGARAAAQPGPATVARSGPPSEPAVEGTASPQEASASPVAVHSGGSSNADSNPADYAAAVEPAQGTPIPGGGSFVAPETEGGLPTYEQAAAAPGADIPSLRLDLHVYAERPDQRFVFLNMVKLREGESLPQGVKVDRITPDGVVLSYRGEKFVLRRR